MSLQIAVIIGRANSITSWHEAENFKTILVQSSEAVQISCVWVRWQEIQSTGRTFREDLVILCSSEL
jgi:hypothetical protein